MTGLVSKKSRTVQNLYVGKGTKTMFCYKSGVHSPALHNIESFKIGLSWLNAQRLSEASEQSVKDIWLSHMAEDLVYQAEKNSELAMIKRMGFYADELMKEECTLSVEDKKHILAVFGKIVDQFLPSYEEDQAEKAKYQTWSDRLHEEQIENERDFYGRLRQDAERDSLGRNRPRQNLERDSTGRRRR